MAVRHLGVNSDGIWGRDMGMPGEERGERNARKVYQIDIEGRSENVSYMVKEEAKRDELGTRAKRRAWRYKENLRKGRRSEIARECLAEMVQREEEMSNWERER